MGNGKDIHFPFFINFATMKRIVTAIILILSFIPVLAQKKEINAAIDNLKANKNLEKVETSMMTLLKDSSNISNEKIWNLLFESLKNNTKLAMKSCISNRNTTPPRCLTLPPECSR